MRRAGRADGAAILKDLNAFETYHIDVAIYDVLGDVVCGGFSMPIREGFAKEIYLVCSGGFMSIYAANNIARAVQRLAKRGDTGLAGIICNSNGDEAFERAVIPAFAEKLGNPVCPVRPPESRDPGLRDGGEGGRRALPRLP